MSRINDFVILSKKSHKRGYPLLQDFCFQTTKSLILLILLNFYVKNVLYHCCTKAEDTYIRFLKIWKGCGRPRPLHVLRKLMYEFLFWMDQTDPSH